MAHRGESSNGRHYSSGRKTRGFGRLQPVSGHTLMDKLKAQGYTEAGAAPPPKEEPKPQPKPESKLESLYKGLDPDEIAEMKRRERIKRITGGK